MEKKSFFDDLDALFGSRSKSAQKKEKFTWQQYLQKTSDDLDRMLIAHAHGNQFLITICNKESKSSKQSSIILDIGFLDSDSDL